MPSRRTQTLPAVEKRDAALAAVVLSKARKLPDKPAARASAAQRASASAMPPPGNHGSLVTKARRPLAGVKLMGLTKSCCRQYSLKFAVQAVPPTLPIQPPKPA